MGGQGPDLRLTARPAAAYDAQREASGRRRPGKAHPGRAPFTRRRSYRCPLGSQLAAEPTWNRSGRRPGRGRRSHTSLRLGWSGAIPRAGGLGGSRCLGLRIARCGRSTSSPGVLDCLIHRLARSVPFSAQATSRGAMEAVPAGEPRLKHAYSGHRLKLGGPSALPPSPRPAQFFPDDARLVAGVERLYATFTRAADRARGIKQADHPGRTNCHVHTYEVQRPGKEGGGALTSHERPAAQGRVCAGDVPTWP